MRVFLRLKNIIVVLFTLILFVVLLPDMASAKLQVTNNDDGTKFTRSLESLRDLDYETWQLVAYSNYSHENDFILRIVGYPGTLRIDHPTSLQVHSGLKNWNLNDITLLNPKLVNDPREAAAEFELTSLLSELTNNRPLRLMLPGVFSELPVPPYLVGEWRSLVEDSQIDEQN